MIETYKIVTGKYQLCVASTLHKGNVCITRGDDLRLGKSQVEYDLRKFGFTHRVVNTWNSLPNWVVSANTTNTFKTRLVKFWHNQGATPTTPPSYIWVRATVWACGRRQTGRHTDASDHNTFRVVYDSREM